MLLRNSRLNGRLENEVDDFVATLMNEFDYAIHSVVITYFDSKEYQEVIHSFSFHADSSCTHKEVDTEND